MKSGTDYLKEYLIKVGWDFDSQSLKIEQNTTGKFISSLLKQFKEVESLGKVAFKAVASDIYYITKETIKLVESQALLSEQIDIQAKKFWTTSENWRAFSGALDTLGIQYKDLFWTTQEQLDKFRELYSLGKSLEPPKAIEETLRDVRSIVQEFNKLKVVGQYFFRALTYYIGEDTKDEIRYWRNTVRDIVKLTAEKMPDAARVIGRALSLVLRFVSAIGRGIKFIYELVSPLIRWISDLPGAIKLIGSMIGLFLLGPIGKIIAALTMVMLLIEDYMYWKAGKHSAFDWSGVDNAITNVKEAFGEVGEVLTSIKEKVGGLFDFLGTEPKYLALTILQTILDAISATVTETVKGVETLLDLLGFVTGKTSFKEFGKILYDRYTPEREWMNNFVLDYVLPEDVANKLRIKYGRDEEVLQDSGIITTGRTSMSNQNNITIDSHDTYNVNSTEEADSLIGVATRRIVKSLNSELSPVVR